MIRRIGKSKGAKKISKAKFAREVGITPQNLNYHLKAGKAPPLGDVEAWVTFLASQGRDTTLPKKLREEIAHERLRLIKESVRKAKMENEAKLRELISFEVASKFVRYLQGTIFFGELERIASEFPVVLKGKDELGIHTECNRQIEMIKQKLRTEVERWVKNKGKV